MTEAQATENGVQRPVEHKSKLRRLTMAAFALVGCALVAFACGGMAQEEIAQNDDVDHDIVLLNNHKIVLQDANRMKRIQIAIEENGRVGIHVYSRRGLNRMFVGTFVQTVNGVMEDVPTIVFFDQTGQQEIRRIDP